MGLQERFESFISTLRGFERIDDLLRGARHERRKRADYLLWNRKVIVEQKVLVSDPADKPQKFVDELMKNRSVTVYGRTSTDAVFGSMSKGEELKRKMFLKMTRSLEDSVAYADKQARDTRAVFSIPGATGVLVLLNESAPTLHPDLIYYGLTHVFQKKIESGSLRYPNNDGVILISGVHALGGLIGSGMQCFSAVSPQPKSDAFPVFSEDLLGRWAHFNGVPFVRYSVAWP